MWVLVPDPCLTSAILQRTLVSKVTTYFPKFHTLDDSKNHNSQVFSGESADSGHGTLDSNEFSGQNDLLDDEMKINQFLPSFSLLPSQ